MSYGSVRIQPQRRHAETLLTGELLCFIICVVVHIRMRLEGLTGANFC